MDLGISGRCAIVCAASAGLGRACAEALAGEGVQLVVSARGHDGIEATAAALRDRYAVQVTPITADVTTEDGRQKILDALPEPDILITNCGGAPQGDFRAWSRSDWIHALDANMLSAVFMIKASVDGMMARKFGRIVNITNVALKGGFPDLALSAGATAGLTASVSSLSRQTVAHNVTINNIVPGRFDTQRLRSNIDDTSRRSGTSLEAVLQDRLSSTPAGRFGAPEELGQLCAFLCGARAGYITGQNILIDGGLYPGTF